MFITFEGMDGSGKTTQAKQAAADLREQGLEVLLTREPGGTSIGDQVRAVLHSLENTAMRPNTELLLYCASRAQLVGEVIRPYLEQGGIVICDRYADSTLAYQGYGHGQDIKTLKIILGFATGGLKPDMTIYLDIPPEDALRRRQTGSLFGEEWNRMDDMTLAFHRRVYAGYRKLMKADPARWVGIDARRPVEQVQGDVLAALAGRI